MRTKINANLGTSRDHVDLEMELEKVRICTKAGADALMDLSTGGEIRAIRQSLIKASTLAVGTVPIYHAAADTLNRGQSIMEMTAGDLFRAIEQNGEDGVDFITVHCGVTRSTVERMKNEGRIMDVVSRGGAFTIEWMLHNNRENPLFEHFDQLLDITKEYDMTLSLGDGFRPGCLADATDRAQIHELIILGELTQRA